MIERPTTFVVGAGASNPYGLPTGPKLLQLARGLDPRRPEYQLIRIAADVPVERLNDVIRDLGEHIAPSIDAFLESRLDDSNTSRLAKFFIAVMLGSAIREKLRTPRPEHDWMAEIVERMRDGTQRPDQFVDGNLVKFVTFNFDSLIEDRLACDLGKIFRVTPQESRDLVARIPVIHVHGRLPAPPKSSMVGGAYSQPTNEWVDWAKTAAEHVRVILDDIERDVLDAACEAIASAKTICCLGFAYNRTNVNRIGMNAAVSDNTPRRIFGSTYGMYEGDRHEVSQRLTGPHTILQFGSSSDDCLSVLRNLPIFC